MAMLQGVTKWANSMKPGWSELLEQGLIISTGDGGLPARGEGRGGLSAGPNGFSWVICGALGGLLSRKIGYATWGELTGFSLDNESESVSFGFESGGREGRVTFTGDFDKYAGSYSTMSGGFSKGPRHRFRDYADKHLPREDWRADGETVSWYRP